MSVESVISCQDVVVIGKPISNLSAMDDDITSADYMVISQFDSDNNRYLSKKYSFGKFDQNYVHLTGDECISGTKTFQVIDSDNVRIGQNSDALLIKSGVSEFNGQIDSNATFNNNASMYIGTKGTLETLGTVIINGPIVAKNGKTLTINMGDDGKKNIKITTQGDSLAINRVDDVGTKSILSVNGNGNDDITVTLGQSGEVGYNVLPYVVNPGEMAEVSSINRIPSTKYVHDNYCNLPRYEYEYKVLSDLEKEHDADTLHKSGVESILSTKILKNAHITRTLSSDGDYKTGIGFCYHEDPNVQLGNVSMKSETGSSGQNNSIRIQCNAIGDEYPTYIELKSHRDGTQVVQQITQNIDPYNQYGRDLATTKWTRDQMIELSDQTHDYQDIVNAPAASSAKKSPSVRAIKDYHDDVIVPENEQRLSNFLSNYLAYDFDDGKKKIKLEELQLVKFKAYYEHKDAEPIDFYVLTPII